MLGLARFAMKSPLHSGILAAFLSFMPLGFVLSAPLVALTTLRHGYTSGTRILVFALLGGIAGFAVFGLPFQLVILPLATVFAMLLRGTSRWSWVLIVSTLLGLILLPGVEFVLGELLEQIAREWMKIVEQYAQSGSAGLATLEDIKRFYLFGISGGIVQMSVLSLLWARYWQAALYNPGGLRAELHVLGFSKAEVLTMMAATALAVMVIGIWAIALFGFPFIFVGLTIVHGIVAKIKLGGQWLVVIYIALVLVNQIIVPLLVLLVLVDSVVDIRHRIPNRTKSDDE